MSVTVLLIDDDQEFLDILAERLTIRGLEVTTTASGRAALDLVRATWFNAIVLDLQMPDLDGLQVLEQLVAFNPAQQIILLTGHATVSKGVQAMKLGAADVLEKPVDIRQLVEKIHALSAVSAMAREEDRPGGLPPPQQECWGQDLRRFLRRLLKREQAE